METSGRKAAALPPDTLLRDAAEVPHGLRIAHRGQRGPWGVFGGPFFVDGQNP